MADLSSFLGGFTGSTIGQAIVRMNVDNSAYSKQLAASEAQLKGFSTNAGAQFSKFGAFATAAWAAAGVAIVKFASDAVAAALDHEQAMATLKNAVGGNTEALEEQANALQYLTGVSDEEILRAEAMLVRFQLTKEEMQRTIPVILDYARATGKELGSATESVGKALLGNTRALKAVGADFKITGNRATDLANLMKLLKERTGGASTELGETEKQIIRISVAFDEAKEKIGAFIIAGVTPAVDAVESFATEIGRTAEIIAGGGEGGGSDFVESLRIGFIELNPFVQTFRYGRGALREFNDQMAGVQPTITEAGRGLKAIKKDMKELGVETTDTRKDLDTFAGMVGADLKKFRSEVKEDFAVSSEAVIGFKAKFEGTVRAFARGLDNMKRRLKDQLEDLKEFNAAEMGDSVRKFFLEQGPDAIHAFADASKETQRSFVEDAKTIAKEQKAMGEEIDRGTGKAKDLKFALGEIGKVDPHATVSVKYVIDTSGENPKDLPGLVKTGG